MKLRVLQQLAENGNDRFSEAAPIILNRTYVDDLFDVVAATAHPRDRLIRLTASVGMELGKRSNRPLLLQGFSAESDKDIYKG